MSLLDCLYGDSEVSKRLEAKLTPEEKLLIKAGLMNNNLEYTEKAENLVVGEIVASKEAELVEKAKKILEQRTEDK